MYIQFKRTSSFQTTVSNGQGFLKASKVPYKTDSLLVPNTRQFFHQLNTVFVNTPIKRKLTEVEFENQKSSFIESADMKQVILSLNLKIKVSR